MTAPSNSQTAGQTLKQNQRITGDSRRQTHSLFRSEKTFGTSSPNMMVKIVSGTTTQDNGQDPRHGRTKARSSVAQERLECSRPRRRRRWPPHWPPTA